METDKTKLAGTRKLSPNTSKYSCSLYEKPNGSINFTKPENKRKIAYENRNMLTINF